MWSLVVNRAVQQHGVVSRRQLLEGGATPDQIRSAVRRGRLDRRAWGVYGVPGVPCTPLSEVMVAVLRAGDGARAAGERLLAALGVRDAAPGADFVVLVPAGRRLSEVEFSWRRDGHPDLGTTAMVQSIPSWSFSRNLMEAAQDAVADEDVHRLANGVRRVGRQRGVAASRAVLEAPSHPGARRLVLLGSVDADAAESDPERVLEHVLWRFGPRRQVELPGGVRVDLLLPDLRVVVEYDGYADHASLAAVQDGCSRDDAIRQLGYAVVHVTAPDLRDPAGIIRRVLAAAANLH